MKDITASGRTREPKAWAVPRVLTNWRLPSCRPWVAHCLSLTLTVYSRRFPSQETYTGGYIRECVRDSDPWSPDRWSQPQFQENYVAAGGPPIGDRVLAGGESSHTLLSLTSTQRPGAPTYFFTLVGAQGLCAGECKRRV